MRYAGLYGNIKKPRIKSLGDNKTTIDSLINTDLTDRIAPLTTIAEQVSTIVEPLYSSPGLENILGVDAGIGKELSAMGKLSLSYIITR